MSKREHAHFVTTDWLAENLRSPDLVVIDGSWYLPHEKRDQIMFSCGMGFVPAKSRRMLDFLTLDGTWGRGW